MSSSPYDVVVIGAGQAGLALGYHLARRTRDFVIVDGHCRIGDSWRERYDSLVLFTPAIESSLPGMRFTTSAGPFPTKDEMATYLEAYAQRFELPIELGRPVSAVSRVGDEFVVRAATRELRARNVVIATGPYMSPRVPDFAAKLDNDVYQVHASDYRNPSELPAGTALVVGTGASGAQITLEVARERPTVLSVGTIWPAPRPWLVRSPLAWRVSRFMATRNGILPLPWPVGNTTRFYVPNFERDAKRRGVQFVGRAEVADATSVSFSTGEEVEVSSVVWATGYRHSYPWLELPVLDDDGRPVHEQGVTTVPGLFFLGLFRQRTWASAFVRGVGTDAAFIADQIDGRRRNS